MKKKIWIVHTPYSDEFHPFVAFTTKALAERHVQERVAAGSIEDFDISEILLFEKEVPKSTILYFDKYEMFDNNLQHHSWRVVSWETDKVAPVTKAAAKITYETKDMVVGTWIIVAAGVDREAVSQLAKKKAREMRE